MIDLAVSTEYRRVTAGPSDGQVSCDGISARGKNRRIPRFCRHYTSKNTTVKQENEIVERYRLNHAIVVKLYHCYTQFPRNVRLPHRRIATFFRLIVTFLLLWFIGTLTFTSLLRSFLLIISTPCLKKLFLFLSELRQISTKFNKFWYVDGKVAEIICYIYIFHLTWLTSLHYLVKRRCSDFT